MPNRSAPLTRIWRIFQRYAIGRLQLKLPTGPLKGGGHVDSVIVKGGRLYLEGWGMGDRIGLRQGRATTWAVPHINKPGSSERGFAVDQPFEPGPFSVLVQQDGTVVETSFSGVTHWAYGLRRSLLLGPYLVDIIRALPLIWRWLYRGEMGARETLKERLYLVPIRAAVQMHSTVVLADDAPSLSR